MKQGPCVWGGESTLVPPFSEVFKGPNGFASRFWKLGAAKGIWRPLVRRLGTALEIDYISWSSTLNKSKSFSILWLRTITLLEQVTYENIRKLLT